MTTLEPEERRLLDHARDSWSPGAADEQRVLAALRASLGGGGGAPEPMGGGAGPSSADLLGAARATRTAGRFSRWSSRAAFALAIGGSSGVVGYWLGYRSAERDHARSAVSPQHPAPAPDPVAPVAAPAVSQGDPSTATSAGTVDARRPALSSPRGERASAVSSAAASGGSLEEEVRLLRRVDRALREHNPRFALALLSELDATVPRGQLREERFAAETSAKCALDYGSRSILLQDFQARHARSAYLARVRQACGAKTEPARADE